MMRKWLPIGSVLVGRVLAYGQSGPESTAQAAPTEGRSSYRFDGQLVYRTSDGAAVTVFPDAVFIGWGDGGCQIERQSSERMSFYPDGVFQLSVSALRTTAFQVGVDSSGRPTFTKIGSELLRWPCYRFRVEGCNDGIVKFGPKAPGPSIELTCPGRETTPRLDG